jgi:hypothetical protein
VSRRAAPGRPVGTGEEGQDESVPARPVQRRPASNGAAKRFGVRLDLVHAWIKRGLVKGERHDFQAHRRVWWLEIAEDTAARLERLAARRWPIEALFVHERRYPKRWIAVTAPHWGWRRPWRAALVASQPNTPRMNTARTSRQRAASKGSCRWLCRTRGGRRRPGSRAP